MNSQVPPKPLLRNTVADNTSVCGGGFVSHFVFQELRLPLLQGQLSVDKAEALLHLIWSEPTASFQFGNKIT